MKLDRYVIRELTVPFLIGTVAVVLMFQANLLIAVYKSLSPGVPFAGIAKLLLFKTPFFLNMTLPVGTALATSLAMARLTRESELTAMRAAGASILRVMLPISVFGLAVGVGNFYLAEKVMPLAEKEATKLQAEIFLLGGVPDVKSNVSYSFSDFYVNIRTVFREAGDTLRLEDVFLLERRANGEALVYLAKEGTYSNGVWSFPDAQGWFFKDNTLEKPGAEGTAFSFKSNKDLKIFNRLDITDLYSQPQPTEMALEDLRREIATNQQQHMDTTTLQVTYHTRFSVPAACYVFAIVGPVFAIWLGRGGGFTGVLLSILMVMLYYNVFIVSTEVFGRNGWLSPLLAAWTPNILFFVFAVVGLRRLE